MTGPPRLPLLVTGITGVAGYHALRYFAAKHPGQVVGIRPEGGPRVAGPEVDLVDPDDPAAIALLFDRHRFAAVLNCAGNCALKPCELEPRLAWKLNVAVAENLVRECVARGVRMVHLSVDLVFSGDRPGEYREDDPTDPVTVYGRTMVAGEQAVLEADPTACVLRISLPMGHSPGGHAGAIDWIGSRFRHGRPATLYTDEIRTPTYTDCMNALYETALGNGLREILHAGGPRRLSLYQIGQIINRVGGFDPDLLHGIPRSHAGPIPPRAGNVAMDSGKLVRTLGYEPLRPWPFDDRLVPTHRDWHRERPADEPRSPEVLRRLLASGRERGAGC